MVYNTCCGIQRYTMAFRKRGGEHGGSKLTSSTPLINVDLVFRARTILLNQLRNRGFNVSDYDNFSTHEIHTMVVNKQMDMLIELAEAQEEGYSGQRARRVYVKYMLDTVSLRDNKLYDLVDELFQVEEVLDKETGDEIILILPSEPNDTIVKAIDYIYNKDGILIRALYMKRLLFDVTNHDLVPPHRLLTQSETQTLLRKYYLTTTKQLPEISKYDPVAQAIGMRPGDVCEITRPSKTSIQSNYYRVCV